MFKTTKNAFFCLKNQDFLTEITLFSTFQLNVERSLSMSRNLAMGSSGCYSNAGISDDYHSYNVKTNLEVLPDLNKINYSVPLQMIESSDTEYKVL